MPPSSWLQWVPCEQVLHLIPFGRSKLHLKNFVWKSLKWWVSELIPRFTKIFEYLKNFGVIVFGIKKVHSYEIRVHWLAPEPKKSNQTFSKYRVGKNHWNHRNQHSKEQLLFHFYVKITADSSVFRSSFYFFSGILPIYALIKIGFMRHRVWQSWGL